jgi:hypothetical protein
VIKEMDGINDKIKDIIGKEKNIRVERSGKNYI